MLNCLFNKEFGAENEAEACSENYVNFFEVRATHPVLGNQLNSLATRFPTAKESKEPIYSCL